MNKTLRCVNIFFALHQTVWGVPPASSDEQNIKLREHFFSHYIKLFEVCHPPVLMNKTLSCVIIFFALHQTVWGVPPASSDEQNIKLREHFFSHYIKLFEVCHPPVLMNKTLSCVIIFFALHQTVSGVPPASVMNKILRCVNIFFELHQTVWGVPPASSDEQNIKLYD